MVCNPILWLLLPPPRTLVHARRSSTARSRGECNESKTPVNTHQLAIQALTKGITAAAPKCGNAAPIPACLQVTHPSTHPSTANNVAIVAAAFKSLLETKIAEMMPNVRLRPPMHCTKPEAKVLSWVGMPNRAAIVVGERRARRPVLRRKAVTL